MEEGWRRVRKRWGKSSLHIQTSRIGGAGSIAKKTTGTRNTDYEHSGGRGGERAR